MVEFGWRERSALFINRNFLTQLLPRVSNGIAVRTYEKDSEMASTGKRG